MMLLFFIFINFVFVYNFLVIFSLALIFLLNLFIFDILVLVCNTLINILNINLLCMLLASVIILFALFLSLNFNSIFSIHLLAGSSNIILVSENWLVILVSGNWLIILSISIYIGTWITGNKLFIYFSN